MWDLDILEVIIGKGDDILYPRSLTLGFFQLITRGVGRWDTTTTNGVDDSCDRPILDIFLGCGFCYCQPRLRLGFNNEPSQTASMDETFDLIFQLQAFIRIMTVVPMVPTVLVVVPFGGWSIHLPSWRELVLDLHEDFRSGNIQEGIIMEPWRGRLQRASNLSQAVVTWRFFPFSFVLLPFFPLSLI